MTRVLADAIRTGGRRSLAAAIVVLAALALVPATAQALSVGVAWPDPVTVGQGGLIAHVTLTNDADAPATVCNAGDAGGCNGSGGIVVVPSCGAASPGGSCGVPDAGVFALSSTVAIPMGSCGPLVTGFDVVPADPAQGSLRLVPVGGQVVLGAAKSAQATCDIPLTFAVARLPATDTSATAGAQTLQSAAAQAIVTQVLQQGEGRDETTVLPAPVLPPPVVPPPVVVPPVVVPPPVVPPPIAPPPPAPADLDHFKCYEALQSNFRQRTVGTRDQFGQRRARVLRTRLLCNPVSKNGGRVQQPRAHLTCYETRDTGNPTASRTVLVTNQFGRRKLTTGRPNRLCVPSLKRRTAGPLPSTPNPARLLDHFRCYDVQPQPATGSVRLVDQFRTSEARIVQVIRLCNPVRKNNEPVRRPRSHLVCYSIRDAQAFNPIGVRVRNQFGRAALRVRQPQTLCLPSFKEVVATTATAAAPPGLDHLKCYEAEQPQLQPRTVGLRDQFGQTDAKVVATRQLCNPVRNNGGPLRNPRAHLACYETIDLGVVPLSPREVRVSNQFGIRQLSVVKPVSLCVPSLKRKGAGAAPTGPNPALVLDHFRCYDVKPQPAARTVKLVDQFKTTKTKVVRVVRLCNPVRKNNEPVRHARAHLVCHSISEAPFKPLAVTVRNQFGVAGLGVRRPSMLCLPSFKKLVNAAGAEIAG